MPKENLSKIDSLPVRVSGGWIKRKHHYLKEYAKIFTTGMGLKWHERLTFIDLFAGPGRCLIETANIEEDGSPLIALQCSFNRYIFVEESPVLMNALKKRCAESPKAERVAFIQGDSNQSIRQVIERIPSGHLNLAFIDPTDIDIHFETIKALAGVASGVDLLMNIQYGMDIKRNFKVYKDQGEVSKLARFMGVDFDLSQLKEPLDVIKSYKKKNWNVMIQDGGVSGYFYQEYEKRADVFFVICFKTFKRRGFLDKNKQERRTRTARPLL